MKKIFFIIIQCFYCIELLLSLFFLKMYGIERVMLVCLFISSIMLNFYLGSNIADKPAKLLNYILFLIINLVSQTLFLVEIINW